MDNKRMPPPSAFFTVKNSGAKEELSVPEEMENRIHLLEMAFGFMSHSMKSSITRTYERLMRYKKVNLSAGSDTEMKIDGFNAKFPRALSDWSEIFILAYEIIDGKQFNEVISAHKRFTDAELRDRKLFRFKGEVAKMEPIDVVHEDENGELPPPPLEPAAFSKTEFSPQPPPQLLPAAVELEPTVMFGQQPLWPGNLPVFGFDPNSQSIGLPLPLVNIEWQPIQMDQAGEHFVYGVYNAAGQSYVLHNQFAPPTHALGQIRSVSAPTMTPLSEDIFSSAAPTEEPPAKKGRNEDSNEQGNIVVRISSDQIEVDAEEDSAYAFGTPTHNEVPDFRAQANDDIAGMPPASGEPIRLSIAQPRAAVEIPAAIRGNTNKEYTAKLEEECRRRAEKGKKSTEIEEKAARKMKKYNTSCKDRLSDNRPPKENPAVLPAIFPSASTQVNVFPVDSLSESGILNNNGDSEDMPQELDNEHQIAADNIPAALPVDVVPTHLRLSNPNNQFGFANAVIQCLRGVGLHSALQISKRPKPIVKLLRALIAPPFTTTRSVENFVVMYENYQRQQGQSLFEGDAACFQHELVNCTPMNSYKNNYQLISKPIYQCKRCNFKWAKTVDKKRYQVYLREPAVENDVRDIGLDVLLGNKTPTKDAEKTLCPGKNCSSKDASTWLQYYIQTRTNWMAVKVPLFTEEGEKIERRITDLRDVQIKRFRGSASTWSLGACVEHIGDRKSTHHYRAWVKEQGKWNIYEDEAVQRDQNLPVDLKDMYILYFVRL